MYRNKYRLIIPFLFPSVLLYVVFVLYPYLPRHVYQLDAVVGADTESDLYRDG